MEEAAKTLTPVTLELGGKSPCIVDEQVNLALAAKRIAWGKFINAGQTCVAPDYLYVHKKVKEPFLKLLTAAIAEMFSERENFTRIVSEKHFQRLSNFLRSGTIFLGGEVDQEKLFIEPTVLTNVTWDDEVMADEIFGPILPVLEFENLAEVINEIQAKPNPSALYIFSDNQNVQTKDYR